MSAPVQGPRSFRLATERDVDRMAVLARKSYPGFKRPDDELRERMTTKVWGGLECTWLGEENGAPHAAQGCFYEFQIHLWGRTWPVGGLGAVAVAPDARRRGWARDLVVHTESVARERGWPFIILYPFRVEFYASLGWGLAEFRRTYRLRTADLPHSDDAVHVRSGTVAELDRLAPVYRAFAAARHGFLDREIDRWMKLLLRHGPEVAVFERDGQVEGYLFYYFKVDATHALVQDLIVYECVWSTDRAWRALWGFVRNQADQATHTQYNSRGDDAFVHAVANPSAEGGPILGGGYHSASREQVGIMCKVLDVERVAEGRPYGVGSGTIRVSITDPTRADEHMFTLRVESGRGRVIDADESNPQLNLDIATWSSITCGALTLDDAFRMGRATGDLDVVAWTKILTAPRWGFFDGF